MYKATWLWSTTTSLTTSMLCTNISYFLVDPHTFEVIILRKNTNDRNNTSTGVYKLKFNGCSKFYISQTGRSFKTWYIEHTSIQSLTKPLIKSTFAEHILNIHHIYTKIQTNLHILSNGPKLNTTEQYEIYKRYK